MTAFTAPNWTPQCFHRQQIRHSTCRSTHHVCHAAADPLLLRVARGEDAERTPVWLMRQAGRYMAAFRKFSDRMAFRDRSENAEVATELSLQPWRAFQPDGVIMFSDILTPLPSLGIEWDIKKGFGPVISTPVRSMEDVRRLKTMDDPASSLPFVQQILSNLRAEVGSASTVLGFVGSPYTLAAYCIESRAAKNPLEIKHMLHDAPEVLQAFLDHLAEALIVYLCYQIDSGAQVVQLFDSWAHTLTPEEFSSFSLPYAQKVIDGVREKRPGTPLMFHANGGVGKLHRMTGCSADVLGLDWSTDMAEARQVLGSDRVIQGNVDPAVLFASEEVIRREVERCLQQAGPRKHILNVGHGVLQKTPEQAVALFCQLARKSASTPQSVQQDGVLQPSMSLAAGDHEEQASSNNGAVLNISDMEKLKEMGRAEVGLVGC